MIRVPLKPSRDQLEAIFRQKYGDPTRTGWQPRLRSSFEYFTPDEFYEALVSGLVETGCSWVDVGGGRDLFPDNRVLASELAQRCHRMVSVDPSDTIEENVFAHERIKAKVEDLAGGEEFDVGTIRMVAEHVESPGQFVAALARLIKPQGILVVYTVDRWSPVSMASWLTPFWLHHRVKRLLWDTEEKDTFPVFYRMNTRKKLRSLLQAVGFQEQFFFRLADCGIFQRFRMMNRLELSSWKLMRMAGIHYLENCLLGVYQKQRRDDAR